jgi:hypothetical protein
MGAFFAYALGGEISLTLIGKNGAGNTCSQPEGFQKTPEVGKMAATISMKQLFNPP